MKKVRVLKAQMGLWEHPVGEVLEVTESLGERMVAGGSYEWVEEPKTLEQKFNDYNGDPKDLDIDCIEAKVLAQIAKEHYLEVVDNALTNMDYLLADAKDKAYIVKLRKALEAA